MPTRNELHLGANDGLGGSDFADELELELHRAFEQIRCPDQAELSPAELAERVDLTMVISPDEFLV